MQPTRVLVTNAGRGAGINFCRSLRLADQPFHIIGLDQNAFSLFHAEVDERVVVPKGDSPEYWPALRAIIDRTKPDLVYASKTNDELLTISRRRAELGAVTLLPPHEKVLVFEDKWRTYQHLRSAGIKVPDTMLIHSEADLEAAMARYGRVWLRAVAGCGGAGSLPTDDFELGRAWIRRHNGWGKFTGAEVLTDRTATWIGLWRHGELIVSQVRKRLYWEYAYLAPSGVTGITGAQVTARDSAIDEIALQSIAAVDNAPEGIVSVDFTYDHNGVPNPTEIQASRFFTSTLFLARLGLNLPHLYVKLALGGTVQPFQPRHSPLPENMVWIKYVDCLPQLASMSEVETLMRQPSAVREQAEAMK